MQKSQFSKNLRYNPVVLGSRHTDTNFNYNTTQQDAFEILQYVVDDLKDSSPIVNEILNCKVTSTITCNTCQTSSTTEQKYDILSLPITDDINTCISLSLQTETLSGDNSWFCPLCMELKESTKESQITQCGNILILHLKRYKNNGLGLAKDSRTVSCQIGQNQNLTVPISEQDEVSFSNTYKLFASINHSGSLSTGGHYWSYICNDDSNWFMCNDSMIRKVHSAELNNGSSYILFYVRS